MSKPHSEASRAASIRSTRITVPNSGPMKMAARCGVPSSPMLHCPCTEMKVVPEPLMSGPAHGSMLLKVMRSSLCACCTPETRRFSKMIDV